jgi:hypothetical protein|tara:strand:+ start:733 stop:1086 length:354 start_codon:yes stop_codon:yes gene_type:complete
MARLRAIGNNRNISVSLPQKVIDTLTYQLRGKSMKRSVWINDAIDLKLKGMESNPITEMSVLQIFHHLLNRSDTSDEEHVRIAVLYENLFGKLPFLPRNEPKRPPQTSMEPLAASLE